MSTPTPNAALAPLSAALPAGFTFQTISSTLAAGIMLAYNYYNDPDNNPLELTGYENFTAIQVWESDPNGNPFPDPFSDDFLTSTTTVPVQQQAAATCQPSSTSAEQSMGYQFIGFSAAATDGTHNLLVLRGTSTLEEAGYDLLGWGTNTPCQLPSSGSNADAYTYGNVNAYLYDFYVDTDFDAVTSLASSFQSALGALDQNLPLLAGAHSLGVPLLELGLLDAYSFALADSQPFEQPVIVTFGGLHLGDQNFAQAYTTALPITLRIANLCDFVPSMVSLEPVSPIDPYMHVGLPATFVWQTWDDWGNHSMECIYQAMVSSTTNWEIIQYGNRTYPQ